MAELVFVTIEFDATHGRAVEAFGPWLPSEDGSHADEIAEFMKRWHATERKSGVSVTVWRATSPEEYDRRVRTRD
ncbi:MAG: hypothetical protein JWO11_3878 [Nocardioides sp.]|nr:hypothetical protein [Nocardioides sp.]